MYLEKLKIFGFKSFANKTVLDLMPGITSVVGPNGCGKSNIVDAIRWVLGEQKAGTLRSDRMENVIFNGSKNYKPLGMAEVSLVIQNNNGVLPVEYTEVVITRRLFRSGESQYLLNNAPCRLKDINDLLMDTGLTPDAYSVIELSMVETILNGKPEDRRRIFEEAVGITKYKQRRKLTLKKLDATEQDLLRLDDIIGEVRSKVNSLHRQVRRAQRYQELASELKESEIRVATFQFSSIYEELGPLNARFEELRRNRESFTSQISFREAEVEALQADLIKLEGQLREQQQRLNEYNEKIHKREEEVLLSRERLKSLAENKVRLQVEIENLKQRIQTHNAQVATLDQKKTEITAEIEKVKSSFQGEKQELDSLEQVIAKKKSDSRSVEQKVYDEMQSISDKRRTLERFNAQLDNLKERTIRLADEKRAATDKIKTDSTEKQRLLEAMEQQQGDLEGLFETQSALEQESEEHSAQIEKLKNDILKKVSQIESLHQRAAFLIELMESYADYPEGVKYLMKNFGAEKGFQGTIADVIKVEDAHRKAVESALGEMATFLVVADRDAAYLGIQKLNENRQGIVTFLPVKNLTQKTSRPNVPNQSGVIGWADALVTADAQFLPAMNILLGSTLIVDNWDAALSLADQFSEEKIQIVTLAGETVFSWGGVRSGKKQTDTEGLIGRQDQLQQHNRQIESLQDELKVAEKKLRELESDRAENVRKRNTIVQTIKTMQDQTAKSQMALSQIEYRLVQAQERSAKNEEEQQLIKDQQQKLFSQYEALDAELSVHTKIQTEKSEQIKAQQLEIDEYDRTRRELAERVNQLNLRIVELTSIDRNLDREQQQTHHFIREDESAIKTREQTLVNNDGQREDLESRIDELGELLAGDYTEKEQVDKKANELRDQTKSLRETIETKNKTVQQLRSERESNSDAVHQVELRISELRIKADNLYRRLIEEYDWELKRGEIDPDYSVQVDETRIEEVREKIKTLGPVNLLALKEYEQEKERLDFLEKQQEDLITAEQNLKETIQQLNESAQDRFDSVFNDIRQNFINVFKNFFPNGEADLIIVEGDDPLEAAIEIKANPKGKKMESLTLLSGGEKALTAISLLFGIYLVKPSPVCILDEVDAPLDDTNIKRFIHALRDFSGSTQFIIITHNKLTMKSSDCLYGVTMEESGVSKTVSVKLE
ncbi:MAG: chromosome segregation protein SMC [Candidatus Zhuqueibacterota bacterium]